MDQNDIEKDLKDKFIKLLSEEFLSSSAPEEIKIEMRIAVKTKEITDFLVDKVEEFAHDTCRRDVEELYTIRKQILQFLQSAEITFTQFFESMKEQKEKIMEERNEQRKQNSDD